MVWPWAKQCKLWRNGFDSRKVYVSEIKKGIYLPSYYGYIESTMERLRGDLPPLDPVKNLDILISVFIRHCSPHTSAEMIHTNKRNVIAAWK
jgi:hypothetical protein